MPCRRLPCPHLRSTQAAAYADLAKVNAQGKDSRKKQEKLAEVVKSAGNGTAHPSGRRKTGQTGTAYLIHA